MLIHYCNKWPFEILSYICYFIGGAVHTKLKCFFAVLLSHNYVCGNKMFQMFHLISTQKGSITKSMKYRSTTKIRYCAAAVLALLQWSCNVNKYDNKRFNNAKDSRTFLNLLLKGCTTPQGMQSKAPIRANPLTTQYSFFKADKLKNTALIKSCKPVQ